MLIVDEISGQAQEQRTPHFPAAPRYFHLLLSGVIA
jgi:hypothetical protein